MPTNTDRAVSPTELLSAATNPRTTGKELNKIVTRVKSLWFNALWFNCEKEKILVAVLRHKNTKKQTVFRIVKEFENYLVRREAISTPHFDDNMFQIIRQYNDSHAIDMAIGTNKLSALSLISLGTHENSWIRKHALAKLSRLT